MMKTMTLLLIGMSYALHSFASVDSADNQKRLEILKQNKTKTLWTCKKGENAEALTIFEVQSSVSGMLSGSTILAIEDAQVCKAVGVTCPYVGSVSANPMGGPLKYQYRSTRGKYEDTVLFQSEGYGMKLLGVSNGSIPQTVDGANWYFNEGECVLN